MVGSDYWWDREEPTASNQPLVQFVYRGRLVVSLLFYNKREALGEARRFIHDPAGWIDHHFYINRTINPNGDSDDDDERTRAPMRTTRPPFIPHWPCRVMPVVWDTRHQDLIR